MDNFWWNKIINQKSLINGKCFRKGFISLNNDEDLTDRIYLAFLCNLFYPTNDNIEGITESNYALSEMLQFIWRSAIRDGKEIWIYIPSIRMRNLLKQWIKENSIWILKKQRIIKCNLLPLLFSLLFVSEENNQI